MRFHPNLPTLSVAIFVIASGVFTSCSSEAYLEPIDEVTPLLQPQPMKLESVSMLTYPEGLEGLSWAMELPSGEVIEGFYVLSPDGDPVLFEGFEPVIFSSPTEAHLVSIRERSEANHEVTYHTINQFEFVPADALDQILFLGKPGKPSIRLNLAEVD